MLIRRTDQYIDGSHLCCEKNWNHVVSASRFIAGRLMKYVLISKFSTDDFAVFNKSSIISTNTIKFLNQGHVA